MSRPNLTESIYPDSGVADYVTLGIGAANYLILLVLTAIAIHHRDFLPLKAKQLWVLCLSYLSSLIWWFSTSVINIVIPRMEPFISTCSLWGVWGQCFFGFYLFVSLCLFRYYRIYRIIIQGKKFWQYQFLVIVVFMIPALIICAIIEGLKLSEFDNDPKQMTCYVDYYAQIGIIITFVIYVVPLIYLTIALRNVQRGYGDYVENRKIIFLFITVFILYAVSAVANLTDYIWGRCLVDFLIIILIDFVYYFVLGKPLYGCLFDQEKCLREFRKSFQLESLSSHVTDATSHKGSQATTKHKETTTSIDNPEDLIQQLQETQTEMV